MDMVEVDVPVVENTMFVDRDTVAAGSTLAGAVPKVLDGTLADVRWD
jgi:hypothetical protein